MSLIQRAACWVMLQAAKLLGFDTVVTYAPGEFIEALHFATGDAELLTSMKEFLEENKA